jgi:magnesium chelatase subunit D
MCAATHLGGEVFVEHDLVGSIKSELERNYGMALVEEEYVFAVRIPKIYIDELWDDDIQQIIERMRKFDFEKIEKGVITVYVIADESHIEMHPREFFDALSKRNAYIFHKIARQSAERMLTGESDKVMRDLLDEVTEMALQTEITQSKGGSKIEILYVPKARGRVVGYRPYTEGATYDLAILPTIKTAAVHSGKFKHERVRNGGIGIDIRVSDFQEKIHRARVPTFIVLTVDMSGYREDIERRFKCISAVVVALLKACYQRRDQVALITYSGNKATLASSFTTDSEGLHQALLKTPLGGLTPLPSAIQRAAFLLKKRVGEKSGVVKIIVLFTDGSANVPLHPGGHIRRELMQLCTMLKKEVIALLVVDISETGSYRARELAYKTYGRYYHPPVFRRTKVTLGKAFLETVGKEDVSKAIEYGKSILEARHRI